MSHLHTLTIQDVLWLNLQVSNKVQPYDYAKLEEAVFYQFAYGDSTGLLPQAARFITGFMRMAPFESDNDATAFLACVAFLRLNGKALDVASGDVAAFVSAAKQSRPKLEAKVSDAPAGEHLDPRSALQLACNTFHTLAAAKT